MLERSNEVIEIDDENLNSIKYRISSDEKIFLVELNGATIQTWEDYILEIQTKFKFPTSCLDSMDRYLDWMRDLDWLKKDEYVLIINNFNLFLENQPELKNEIISDLTDFILPFWQKEVEEVVVNGQSKPFMIYLVK